MSHKTEKETTTDGDEYEQDGLTDHILHGFPLILCTVSVCLCLLINALDQTIVITFMSQVGSEFNDFGKVSWLVSGFLLPSAVFAMNWGKLALIFGRKYCMLIGIGFFFVGSLICALSKNMDMLIVGRCITGIGGGAIQVCVFLIVTEIVPINRRAITGGIVGGIQGTSSVFGPLIGGGLAKVSWRWNFWLALPLTGVGAISLILFYKPPIPKGSMKEKFQQIDYIGTVLLCAGLVLVLLALTFGSTSKPWNSAIVISFFVVGGVMLVAYFVYNFTVCKNPMFPAEVFKVIQVVAPCLAIFFLFSGLMGAMVFLSTYFQIVWDKSPMQSGISLLPLILATVITSIAMGVVVSKTRHTKIFSLSGAAISAVGLGLLSMLDESTSTSKQIGYLIVPGIGFGCSVQSIGMSIQVASRRKKSSVSSEETEEQRKKASGDALLIAATAVAFFRALGGMIGSSIGQTVLSSVFKSEMNGIDLPGHIDPMSLLNAPEAIRQLPSDLASELIRAFVDGFQKTMYFGMGLQVAGFVTCLFLTNALIPKPQKNNPDEEQHTEKEPGNSVLTTSPSSK